jgi:hypothetical protein
MLLACSFAAGLAGAQSISIQNPSFETATMSIFNSNGSANNLVAGSTISGEPTGGTLANWTASSTTLAAAAGAFAPNPGGNNWSSPWWTGNNIGYLQTSAAGTVSLSQTLPTLLQNGTTYAATMLVGRRGFTPRFNYSLELWAGTTKLGSSSLNLANGNTLAVALLTYDTGTNSAQAGQPLMIVISSTGADGIVTEAFFENLLLTAISDSLVTKILPQLAFGGGWYTALYFTNTTTFPVALNVNFIGNDGNPLNIPALGGSSVTPSLAARGTTLIEIPNSGPLVQGYVSAGLPAGVTGYGVFRQSVAGVNDQEAVVPLSGNTVTTSTLLFDDTKYVTAFAVVNLDSVANAITAVARDTLGNIIGTTSVPLAANAKTAAVLKNLIGGIAGMVGSVDFTVTSGNLAVLGLRFNNLAFTSIPTSDK